MREQDVALYSIGRRGTGELRRVAATNRVVVEGGQLKADAKFRMERYIATGPVIIGLCLCFSACASVDTILLTNDTFPPKGSAEEVAVLRQTPTRPHRDLAELRIDDTWLSFGSMQHKILNRAATLGADAVVFTQPQTRTIRRETYQPIYGPWGYNSPYYGGPWGYGMYGGLYGGWGPWGGVPFGSMAVPYEYHETVRILTGTAIRYTDGSGPQSGITSNEPGSQALSSIEEEETVRSSNQLDVRHESLGHHVGRQTDAMGRS
ncbi:MAG: hypothetical protein P0120_02275 [Nitrospira sp.]|nr:hypothetical protein [Nitrospira sp.]